MAPDPHTVGRAAGGGPWNLDALTTRLAALGGWRGPDEIGWTAAALVGRWRRPPRTTPERLVGPITELLADRPGLRVRPAVPEPRWRWPVARWSDLDTLALGLDLRVGELDWFADPGGWLTRAPEGPLHHYRRRWTTSRTGAAAAGVARATVAGAAVPGRAEGAGRHPRARRRARLRPGSLAAHACGGPGSERGARPGRRACARSSPTSGGSGSARCTATPRLRRPSRQRVRARRRRGSRDSPS